MAEYRDGDVVELAGGRLAVVRQDVGGGLYLEGTAPFVMGDLATFNIVRVVGRENCSEREVQLEAAMRELLSAWYEGIIIVDEEWRDRLTAIVEGSGDEG